MFVVDKVCIENADFMVESSKTAWFVDSDYRNILFKLQG